MHFDKSFTLLLYSEGLDLATFSRILVETRDTVRLSGHLGFLGKVEVTDHFLSHISRLESSLLINTHTLVREGARIRKLWSFNMLRHHLDW